MNIGIPREILPGETRVAMVPGMISTFMRNKHEVFVEAGAGVGAGFSDEQYREAGATIVHDVIELYQNSEVVLKVQPPQKLSKTKKTEADLLREGATLIGFLAPLNNLATIKKLAARKITSFAMEYIPRITRAQNMDALSSMATVAGYKAVLIAAERLGKFFPLLMTAAGTIAPSTVLILGAGVAGLQAIATAKRLGAKVEAFDPRPAVKEQVQSLGAQFVEMEITEDVETAGGYAREQSEAFLQKERQTIGARLPKVDVVITTAQVFGKRAPLLLTEEMVKMMRPGSVIVDLAAEQGGNCELTEAGQIVEKHGVTIIGAVNLAATVPVHASQMYAKNITNLFFHLHQSAEGRFNFDDEITKGACITHNGEIVNAMIKNALQPEGSKP
ncbi:MAG: Re/Si-specific NAD(P)(+) transhydrogenase subunit alpha [candidate division KSB1 bacterium]|nr:Re/Si-specific NAD(P)(+) transhydrogenase subunit alpha [candidate division KSB1 bacterium]MDZ7313354.1 Re/Si-specific NAD(P)(+) transhydrogenase subunit alpha [candidate division KSB1 bacterium]